MIAHPAVAAAEDQNLDELVKHDLIGDAAALTAERMDGLPGRQKVANWAHRGSRMQDARAGTGTSTVWVFEHAQTAANGRASQIGSRLAGRSAELGPKVRDAGAVSGAATPDARHGISRSAS